jgi:hypothetical protein
MRRSSAFHSALGISVSFLMMPMLSACGGSGGSGAPQSDTGALVPSVAQSPPPKSTEAVPSVFKKTFAYSITMATTGAPTTTTTGTYLITNTYGQSFNGVNGLIRTEIDYGTGGLYQLIYQNIVRSGFFSADVKVIGQVTNFEYPTTPASPYTVNEAYVSPYYIEDVIPEHKGGTFSRNQTATLTYSGYVTGTTDANANGAYSLTQSVAGNSFAINLNADGSGTDVITTPPNTTAWTFGLPTTVSGATVIPVMASFNGGAPTVTNVPDWFPGGGAASQPLQTDTVTENGPTPLPASCNVPPEYAILSTSSTEVFYELDPVGGYTTTYTLDEYDSPIFGSLCYNQVTTINSYDNVDTGTLQATQTVTYQWSLQKVSLPFTLFSSARSNASSSSAMPSADTAAAADFAMRALVQGKAAMLGRHLKNRAPVR